MDITLLQTSSVTSVLAVPGFNPCFNGYYTSTGLEIKNFSIIEKVSILVLMDITLLQCVPSLPRHNAIQFQSLF